MYIAGFNIKYLPALLAILPPTSMIERIESGFYGSVDNKSGFVSGVDVHGIAGFPN